MVGGKGLGVFFSKAEFGGFPVRDSCVCIRAEWAVEFAPVCRLSRRATRARRRASDRFRAATSASPHVTQAAARRVTAASNAGATATIRCWCCGAQIARGSRGRRRTRCCAARCPAARRCPRVRISARLGGFVVPRPAPWGLDLLTAAQPNSTLFAVLSLLQQGHAMPPLFVWVHWESARIN